LPREAGLLSDEAAAAFKLKVTETGKRLAESLGKCAACTTSVARQLSGQGASHGRAIWARLRQERVSSRCWLACGAVVGLAAVAGACIEWQAHRPISPPEAPAAAQVEADQEATSASSDAPHPSKLPEYRGPISPTAGAIPVPLPSGGAHTLSASSRAPDVAEAAHHRLIVLKPKAHTEKPAKRDLQWEAKARSKLDHWFEGRGH
jgi:hypothetical protein